MIRLGKEDKVGMNAKIKELVEVFLRRLPLRDIILFESIPDFSDNTKAVFDEMVRRGIHNKYKFIWAVGSKDRFSSEKNSVCTQIWRKDTIRFHFYRAVAKGMISCNRALVPVQEEQFSIYLSHGTPIKQTRDYYTIPEKIRYCLAASEEAAVLLAREMRVPAEKMVPLGYPRNDVFSKASIDIGGFWDHTYSKIIVWYPTFRNHKGTEKNYGGDALPVIHDKDKAIMLNETAKRLNVLVVIKPHFAQDTKYMEDLSLSNIVFIDDTFFVRNKISSYEFVGSCDALITDYSSIYYDFTLCDKPIASVLEDFEEYSKNPGVIEEFDYYLKGAERVYTLEDLCQFVENVYSGNDVKKKERNEIKNLVNYSTEGNAASRVVDFIVEKMKI